jgi:hypothetical protein
MTEAEMRELFFAIPEPWRETAEWVWYECTCPQCSITRAASDALAEQTDREFMEGAA